MMNQSKERMVRWGAIVFALLLMAWGLLMGRGVAAPPQIDAKTIPLKPHVTFVKASFLTGELQDMRVTERVEHGTGKMADTPVFRATLTITNDSEDQAARLLGGKIEYIDPQGMHIPAPHTIFTFIGVPSDRLDPGGRTSQVIEVPFPAAALKPNGLWQVSLELTYLPFPYREDTANIPVYLGTSGQTNPGANTVHSPSK